MLAMPQYCVDFKKYIILSLSKCKNKGIESHDNDKDVLQHITRKFSKADKPAR